VRPLYSNQQTLVQADQGSRVVPQCMARPRSTRWLSKIDERESCINVSGLLVEQICSGPSWVSARIQAD
jgi:hypothetical protein